MLSQGGKNAFRVDLANASKNKMLNMSGRGLSE
jgi:hypothetical protein